MDRFYKQIILFIITITAVFVSACGSINPPPQTAISLDLPPVGASKSSFQPTTMPTATVQPTALPTSTQAPTVVATTTIPAKRRTNMQIRIKADDKVITATLNDSETALDFISQLPLSFTLEDYAGTEKIFYFSKKLSTRNAPQGSDPSVGDIAYYAPWGNLAIYYKDFGYSNGLVILGKIDSGLDALSMAGSLKVTVELAE